MFKSLLLFIFIFTSALLVNAQDLYQVKSGLISFTSDAPLELIKAKCNVVQGVINTTDRALVFRVPMNKFIGFNSELQKTHFNTNYLETTTYPYTIFEGKIIEEVDFSIPGTYTVRGKGRFTCHGVEQERIIKCTLVVKPPLMQVSAEFTVLLDDHDIQIPSVVNQRIAEEISVIISIELQQK